MFASTAVARRIEQAECRLLSDAVVALGRRKPEADVIIMPLAGGVAVYAGEGSPLNKLAGLGFDGPLDVDDLAAVERAFATRGAPLQVELSSLADPSIGARLTRRGYALEGLEHVLGQRLPVDQQSVADVHVAPSDADEFPLWLDMLVGGFMFPDTEGVPSHESFDRETLERVIGETACADSFLRYVARCDGVPAGGASMQLHGTTAVLCGAATLPAFRRRGVQTALLSARLAHASAAGCDLVVVTTQPGSKSHENVQRRGFGLLYARAILRLSARPLA